MFTLGNPAQMFFMCHYERMANLHVWRSGLLIHSEKGKSQKASDRSDAELENWKQAAFASCFMIRNRKYINIMIVFYHKFFLQMPI